PVPVAAGEYAHDQPLGPRPLYLRLRHPGRLAVAGLLRGLARHRGMAVTGGQIAPHPRPLPHEGGRGDSSLPPPPGGRGGGGGEGAGEARFPEAGTWALKRRSKVAHWLQVGAGSGGMPVLDMLARDRRLTRVTLIEPDVYKPHNVERHLFPLVAV